MLKEIRDGAAGHGIDVRVAFDGGVHDRWIRACTGWRINLGRGRDIFQKFEGGWMDFASSRHELGPVWAIISSGLAPVTLSRKLTGSGAVLEKHDLDVLAAVVDPQNLDGTFMYCEGDHHTATETERANAGAQVVSCCAPQWEVCKIIAIVEDRGDILLGTVRKPRLFSYPQIEVGELLPRT
jgi:hypothetical protein